MLGSNPQQQEPVISANKIMCILVTTMSDNHGRKVSFQKTINYYNFCLCTVIKDG
jgi:hypothetical protein